MYQISANLVNRELRNANYEGKKTLNLEPQSQGLYISYISRTCERDALVQGGDGGVAAGLG